MKGQPPAATKRFTVLRLHPSSCPSRRVPQPRRCGPVIAATSSGSGMPSLRGSLTRTGPARGPSSILDSSTSKGTVLGVVRGSVLPCRPRATLPGSASATETGALSANASGARDFGERCSDPRLKTVQSRLEPTGGAMTRPFGLWGAALASRSSRLPDRSRRTIRKGGPSPPPYRPLGTFVPAPAFPSAAGFDRLCGRVSLLPGSADLAGLAGDPGAAAALGCWRSAS